MIERESVTYEQVGVSARKSGHVARAQRGVTLQSSCYEYACCAELFTEKAAPDGLTPLLGSDTIAAVTLTSRHSGAVSDPVRYGPDVRVRSLKTEQCSSA